MQQFQREVLASRQSKADVFIDTYPNEDDPYYTVVVAEFFSDHRTTFNRYRVSADFTVYRYNPAQDMWEAVEYRSD